jgi:hypothetical protein
MFAVRISDAYVLAVGPLLGNELGLVREVFRRPVIHQMVPACIVEYGHIRRAPHRKEHPLKREGFTWKDGA